MLGFFVARKLSKREKAGYGVADVGASLTYVTVNTWLFYFLVNIVGLEPLLAGLVFILGRVFDAVIDPVMGVISDRLRPRFGRKRFISWGAVPLGISFVLVWLSAGSSQLVTLATSLFFFMLFSLWYTIVQIPYLALTPELAPDYDERTSLTSYRMSFGVFASLLAVAAPPLIISSVSGVSELTQSPPWAWIVVGLAFGAITALCYLLAARSISEPEQVASKAGSSSFFADYRAAFRVHGFRTLFCLFVLVTTGLMVINSVLPFFLESNLDLGANEQSVVLGGLFGVAIISLPVWTGLTERYGKRSALSAGLAILALGAVLLSRLTADSPSLALSLFTVMAGFGLSAVMLLPWAMLPDVVEFAELAGGRHEGLLYALFTFGQKLAGSVGVFANAIVATLFGYQQGIQQTPETLRAIAFMAGPAAALVFLLAVTVTLRFPITREKHAAASAQLDRRDLSS